MAVVNRDASSLPGQHSVAIYITENKLRYFLTVSGTTWTIFQGVLCGKPATVYIYFVVEDRFRVPSPQPALNNVMHAFFWCHIECRIAFTQPINMCGGNLVFNSPCFFVLVGKYNKFHMFQICL